MNKIEWLTRKVSFPDISFEIVEEWLDAVILGRSKFRGEIVYVFCDDSEILSVNRQFLSHDYYTDIITFDYSHGRYVSGDIFISLDTVKSNAVKFNRNYEEELYRVIVHGVLHLCGINDKGPGEREIMEGFENSALQMLQRFGVILSSEN